MHVLEEILSGCRRQIRLIRVLLISEYKWYSRYELEKMTGTKIERKLLQKLVRCGILQYDDIVNKYRLNRESAIVNAFRNFFREVGYLL
ncbi:MAG: hypothetical protein DRJ32_00340 [Thermoprotei archaeon]|nr:MAG: hypothetical protein B6U94_01000 [Thermofilum sp. ex4484_79]RLE61758.1 MAG: hypothetical protein DRJ32_00340 [Thermoprotei archaeon]HDD63690.1 hypothetical protein [Thermoprotei archaeon]